MWPRYKAEVRRFLHIIHIELHRQMNEKENWFQEVDTDSQIELTATNESKT
jgi:hypothetical protein